MKNDTDARPGGTPDQPPKTPNTDMQADDAGTAESGADPEAGGGTAAESAMKQTSKTDPESGSQR